MCIMSLYTSWLKDEDSWRAREAELNLEITNMKTVITTQAQDCEKEKETFSQQLSELTPSGDQDSNWEHQKTELVQRIDDLEQTETKLGLEKDALLSKLETSEDLNRELVDKQKELSDTIEQINQQLEKVEVDNRSLETNNAMLSEEKEELYQVKLSLEKSISELKEQLTEISKQHSKQTDSDLEFARNETIEYKTRAEEQQACLQSLTAEKLHLEKTNSENLQEVDRLKESKADLEHKIAELDQIKRDNMDLKEKLKSLEAEVDSLSSKSLPLIENGDHQEDLYDITTLVEENRQDIIFCY